MLTPSISSPFILFLGLNLISERIVSPIITVLTSVTYEMAKRVSN